MKPLSLMSRGPKKRVASVAGFAVKSNNSFLDNTAGNESGIKFFGGKQDAVGEDDEKFEVTVDKSEFELKTELLQFIHCQAMYLEEQSKIRESFN